MGKPIRRKALDVYKRQDHGSVFFIFCFVELLHVHRFGFPVDSFDFRIRFEVGFLHLKGDKSAGKGYYANVMSGGSFNGNNVSPVSYTHLDVYKRQGRWMICPTLMMDYPIC